MGEKYELGLKCGMNNIGQGAPCTVPDLECVDYIFNPKIAKQFEETRKDFESRGIPVKERRIFHATHNDNIMPIISGNFDIDAKRVDGNKIMSLGRGIYFSDFPPCALGYGKGNSILMCRVLTGIESTYESYQAYIPGVSSNKFSNYNTF